MVFCSEANTASDQKDLKDADEFIVAQDVNKEFSISKFQKTNYSK